ncbi:MAG: serine hydrolase domain-containing protein [Thermodesulfobacteriota bacterium]
MPADLMKDAHTLMKQAVTEGVFPGGVLVVSRAGRIQLCEAYGVTNLSGGVSVTPETIFDLASLTKPLATTPAVMLLVQQRRLLLTDPIGPLLTSFASSPKSVIMIRQLLNHTSGLPDYREYYWQLAALPLKERSAALKGLLSREELVHPVGQRTVYSDLGFMILQWIVESIAGRRLDSFVTEEVYHPLGLNDLFFIDLFSTPETDERKRVFAATEKCPWRKQVLEGVVHDDNAYVVGGVAGHAGLFGTALNVHELLVELSSCFSGGNHRGIFQREVVRTFLTPPPDGGRPLGFDRPSGPNSSSGRYFSGQTVGHLGFTGTSFWMDLEKEVIVVLLTNRVHPSRTNEGIKAFRPNLHDTVMKSV